MAHARHRHLGFTLLELMIALGIAAVLGALAVPGFASLLERTRLEAAARNLQADIALARQEAGRRGQRVRLVFRLGTDWCYALGVSSALDCRVADPSRDTGLIKVVRGVPSDGISLQAADAMSLDAGNGASLSLTASAHARFASREGRQLQVQLNRLGRASLCAPDTPVAGAPPCPVETRRD